MGDKLSWADIRRLQQEGMAEASLEGNLWYVLILYELYPNGTTSPCFVEDQDVARKVGQRMGIGNPTDRCGWGIWEVPSDG